MAKPLKGKEMAWKSGIDCNTCKKPVFVYVDNFGETWVKYKYLCKGCKIEGPWEHLAKGYFEWSRKNGSGNQTEKTSVVDF